MFELRICSGEHTITGPVQATTPAANAVSKWRACFPRFPKAKNVF